MFTVTQHPALRAKRKKAIEVLVIQDVVVVAVVLSNAPPKTKKNLFRKIVAAQGTKLVS